MAIAPTPAGAVTLETVTGRVSGAVDRTNASGNDVVPDLPSSTDRVYLRDTLTESLVLVSVTSAGEPGSGRVGAVTRDGRFVAFVSAQKLVASDTNDTSDVYVRDRMLALTELVSVSGAEVVGDEKSGNFTGGSILDISDDGRYVAFESEATNLLGPGVDSNAVADVFRRDRTLGVTARVSQTASTAANGPSRYPSMSADGATVVFATSASNLIANDSNSMSDVVLRRMDVLSANVRVSQGTAVNPDGPSNLPDLSDDGKVVAFTSSASNLVAGDTNAASDVFVRNVATNTTTRASVWTGGTQIFGPSDHASISPDGTKVAFETSGRPSAAEDPDMLRDVYVRQGASTTRQSIGAGASDTSHDVFGSDLSSHTTVFTSAARLAPIDTANGVDAFVRQTPFVGPHVGLADFVVTSHERIAGSVTDAQVGAAVAAIRSGASTEHQVVSLVDQPAFSAKKAPVMRLYWAYFKREPDLNGLNYWVNQYASGKSLQRISLQFAQSSEFRTKYGNTTAAQFVTLVYQNVLERQPEPSGLAYWVNQIDNGTSRGQVMTSFSESSEGKRTMAPYVDTVLIGLGMIGKIPSPTLFNSSVAQLKAGSPKETVVGYVLDSNEYAATL
jgi:Tol biopolymer transport system component